MYNRYIGNTGRVHRIDDAPASTRNHQHSAPAQKNTSLRRPSGEESKPKDAGRRAPLPAAQCQRPPSPLSGLSGIASEIMKKLSPGAFETEDILLILILWLLYKESGDEELLFTMIALFLL